MNILDLIGSRFKMADPYAMAAHGDQHAVAPQHMPTGVLSSPMPEAQPTAPTEAPKKGGILGALKDIFIPEEDSFMYAALNNPNGLWGARGAQQEFKRDRAADELGIRKTEQELAQGERKAQYQIAGNNLIFFPPDGGIPQIITPPTTPGEQERLLLRWMETTDPKVKEMIGYMLRGVQYRPEVINSQADARTRTGVAVARERGAQSRATKATPSAASPTSGVAKLPAGFILNP